MLSPQGVVTHYCLLLPNRPGSLYYTDNWIAYALLSINGNHVVVPKEKGIDKGKDHLNGVEGFWS